MIRIKNEFDLDSTITCGQIFRYEYINGEYIVILNDRVISIKKDNNYIIVESSNEENLEEVIYDYFDLNRNYDEIIKKIIECDNKIKDAALFSIGMRIIHQDSFECLISYVISQNNSVRNITNSLNLLSYKYGKKIIFRNKEYYLFPSINDFCKLTLDDYRKCKVGFRDKYLYEIIQNIKDNKLDLSLIDKLSSNQALKYLMSFKGIGMKVASCILLFAYQKLDVYPIDTWVKKFMLDDYNIEGENNIRSFTQKNYKEYSGLAIQYMFNYKRNKKIEINN